MSKELKEAIRLTEIYLEANGPRLAPVYNSALRLVIEAAEELIKIKKDIDEGVLVLDGTEQGGKK